MDYNASSRNEQSSAALGNAIAGLFVAGITFVLGYTVVRASLAQNNFAPADTTADIEMVIPHEGTLWADFGTQY